MSIELQKRVQTLEQQVAQLQARLTALEQRPAPQQTLRLQQKEGRK